MKLIKLFLLFLIFSVVVQNTCLYGMAGKTSFMPKETHQCPLKKHSQANTDDSSQKAMHQPGQTFVFTVSSSINAKPLSLPEVSCFFSEMNLYKNIFVEPPVKPPVA